jgi:hypothetical protein
MPGWLTPATLVYPVENDTAVPPRFRLRIIAPKGVSWSLKSAAPPGRQRQNPNAGIAKLVFRLEPAARRMRLVVLLSTDANACANPQMPPLDRPLSEWTGLPTPSA